MVEEYGTMEEEKMVEEKNPIEVNDEVIIGDLTDVPDGPTLIPNANNVKLKVTKVESVGNAWKMLKLTYKLVDGVEGKFKGALVNNVITYSVDPEGVAKSGTPYKELPSVQDKSYLKDFKLTFMGTKRGQREIPPVFNVEQPIKVNDDFMQNLVGQECLGTIVQKDDDYNGMINEVKFLKPINNDDLV